MYLKVICILLIIFMNVLIEKSQRITDEQVSIMAGQLFIDSW